MIGDSYPSSLIDRLHRNIATLKMQLKTSEKIIKDLRMELAKAKQQTIKIDSWVELNDGKDN
jgi:hypothetical protein|tara:strand:+ start:418 stop:603 length:186 start_codon:yes stop_codon:yes gene_type:complete